MGGKLLRSFLFYLLLLCRVECWAGPKFDAGSAQKVVFHLIQFVSMASNQPHFPPGGRWPVCVRVPWSRRRVLWRRRSHGCLGDREQERR